MRRHLRAAASAALLSSLSSVMPHSAAASENDVAIAAVEIRPTDGGLRLEGKAIALSDISVAGAMEIERSGASGNVSTRQASKLDLAAGETGVIASVNVSFSPGDTLKVTVTLREGDTVVSQASVTTGRGQ